MYIIYGKPNCPYCVRAKELLDSKGLDYRYKDVMADEETFSEMVKAVGKRPKTVPQIFCDEEYVGGFDELYSTFVMKAVVNDLGKDELWGEI